MMDSLSFLILGVLHMFLKVYTVYITLKYDSINQESWWIINKLKYRNSINVNKYIEKSFFLVSHFFHEAFRFSAIDLLKNK